MHICGLVLVVVLLGWAQAVPSIGHVNVTCGIAQVYSKFEVAFNITSSNGSYSNPYDPAIINVYQSHFHKT